VDDSADIRTLQELIAALDRRRPRAHHPGEAAIANESAALRSRALERLAELERRRTSID
jgi:hypothetical protein